MVSQMYVWLVQKNKFHTLNCSLLNINYVSQTVRKNWGKGIHQTDNSLRSYANRHITWNLQSGGHKCASTAMNCSCYSTLLSWGQFMEILGRWRVLFCCWVTVHCMCHTTVWPFTCKLQIKTINLMKKKTMLRFWAVVGVVRALHLVQGHCACHLCMCVLPPFILHPSQGPGTQAT